MTGVQNNTTVTNGTQSPVPWLPNYLEEPLAATVFQITLWSMVAFMGVIGNLLVCIVILRRLKKTSMNYYLLSLAIADLGVLVIIYPVAVCKYIKPFVWLLGETFCLYMIPTEEIFYGASIWSITAIAIERYRNIVGANRYQVWNRSKARTAFGIFAVWLSSFLVSCVPLYPVMKYNPKGPIGPMCGPNMSKTYVVTYFIALVVLWYVLPLAVITFTYVKIKQRVLVSATFRNSMAIDDNQDFTKPPKQSVFSRQNKDRRLWRQSNKTKRVLTPLVILFAVTMFPVNALRIVILIDNNISMNKYYNLAIGIMSLFVIVNSAANPLVYYLTSKEFKEAYKAVLKALRGRRKDFLYQFRRSSSRYSFGLPSSGSTKTVDIGIDAKMFSNGLNNGNYRQSVVSQLSHGDVQFESGL